MAETAIQFLERWRRAHVYAEQRALEQLDENVSSAAFSFPHELSAGDFPRASESSGGTEGDGHPAPNNQGLGSLRTFPAENSGTGNGSAFELRRRAIIKDLL